MAISTPVTIGNNTPATTTVGSVTLTTATNAVTAGGVAVLHVGWFNTSGTVLISSASGGGVTWNVESQITSTLENTGFLWADCPSGIGTGTSIVVSMAASTAGSMHIAGMTFTGAATGGPSSKTSSTNTTGPTWTTGSLAVASGNVLIGNQFAGEFSGMTNTASGGNTEVHDFQIAGDSGSTTCYQFGTGASIAGSGTWSTTYDVGGGLAHVWSPASTTPVVDPHTFSAIPFQGQGRNL